MRAAAIFADMEGISGITSYRQCFDAYPEFAEGRRLYTGDILAAIQGLKQGGFGEIRLLDTHTWGRQDNFVTEDLPADVAILRGLQVRERCAEALEGSEALVILGIHAAGGTNGFMSHTESPNPQLIINGRLCGEMTLNAGLADALGVRTLLVTGDNVVTHEVESNFGGIQCVEVKVSRSRAHCVSIAPETAHKSIEEAARQAASDRASSWPLKIIPPYECELTFPSVEIARAAGIMPGATLSGNTVSYKAAGFQDVVRFVDTACDLGRYLLMQQMTAKLKDTAADVIDAGRREMVEALFAG